MLHKAIIHTATVLALALGTLAHAQDNRVDTIRIDAPELAKFGKFSIGVKTLTMTNPKQLDILKAKAGEPIPSYDRPLTVEVWYPGKASDALSSGQYRTQIRDGKTETILSGKATRDGAAETSGAPYPLVIISHGYPGNRFLLSHLAENLASKGYVVASIDHTDSTYSDQGAFGSTLLNRPLDQLFVLNEMARLNANDPGTTLKGLVNADNTALIGYSMGGYGVVNTIGGGFTSAIVANPVAPPNGALATRQAGSATHIASMDARIKAAVAIAPWGWNRGFWDAASLSAIKTPVFYVAGSVDDISGYSPGVRNIYEGSVNAPRFLLTYENANHNAAAPIPAPKEALNPPPGVTSNPANHYIDAVWDSVRMNNIAQHFTTAFLGKYLKSDASMDSYLSLVENAKDGKWSAETTGAFKADHTYWKGFANRTAAGLRFEQKKP